MFLLSEVANKSNGEGAAGTKTPQEGEKQGREDAKKPAILSDAGEVR
jgi:hypothetical protein